MVSIIIPVYNAEKYLEECLNSVIVQTDQDIEIICVDDGSTDESVKLINQMKRSDNRIKLFFQEHKGAGEARNYGISRSIGEYIAFLDADDFYFDADALKKMTEYCDKENLNICGSYRLIYENGEFIEHELLKEIKIPETGKTLHYRECQYDFDYQSYIFRRKFLVENNLKFPEYMRFQDPPFFVRAMLKADRFGAVPVTLYCYRLGHKNTDVIRKHIKDILRGIFDVIRLADENGLEKLYRTEIGRINGEYYEPVCMEFDAEIGNILAELSAYNDISKFYESIAIQEDIRSLPLYKSNSEKYTLLPSEKERLARSFELLMEINNCLYDIDPFRKYFIDREIKRVVIRGMGMFGKQLARLLTVAGIEIVAGIDRNKNLIFDNLRMILPTDDIPVCDAVIISPIEPEAIRDEYDGIECQIIIFKEVLEELKEVYEHRK